MEYNIQSKEEFETRKKLIEESIAIFLNSPAEKTTLHLSLKEAIWVVQKFPEINLSRKKNSKKMHGRICYVLAKDTPSL